MAERRILHAAAVCYSYDEHLEHVMCKSFIDFNASMTVDVCMKCATTFHWTLHRKIWGNFATLVLPSMCNEIILFLIV